MKNKSYLQIIFAVFVISGFCYGQSDLNIIKERIVSEIMKSPVDDSIVTKMVETSKKDGTWLGINYKNVSNKGFEHRKHTANLVTLARLSLFKTSSV